MSAEQKKLFAETISDDFKRTMAGHVLMSAFIELMAFPLTQVKELANAIEKDEALPKDPEEAKLAQDTFGDNWQSEALEGRDNMVRFLRRLIVAKEEYLDKKGEEWFLTDHPAKEFTPTVPKAPVQ